MGLVSALRETFTVRALRGEMPASGMLDRMAAFGLVLAGCLYVLVDTLGGMFRGVLGSVGLAPILYIPAIIGLVALVANMLTRVGDPRTAVPIFATVGCLALEILIALMMGRAIGAIFFQLYIFLPGFILAALAQRRMQDRVIRWMAPMFFIATFGVLLNIFVQFPWAGTTFEVLGQQRDAAREWTSYGQDRLAGFSRASYYASTQIVLGFCIVESRVRSLALRGICWVLGLVAVYHTTQKSCLLALALLPATYVLIGRIRQTGAARRRSLAILMMLFWVLLIFAGPLIATFYGPQLFPQGTGSGVGYNSLADRILNTWPNALALVDWSNPVSWLVGRGLGGIGSAQVLFEPGIANPGDNLAIYLFVVLGMGGLAIGYLIFRGGQRAIMSNSRGRRDFALIIAMLGMGAASNVLENATSIMILALAMTRPQSRAISNVTTFSEGDGDVSGDPPRRPRSRRSRSGTASGSARS